MPDSSPSPLVVACGTEEAPPAIRPLAIGALSFDLEAGKLRYIRHSGIEVLRSIAFVVRGPGWETLAPTISDIEVVPGAQELRATWHARYQFGEHRLEVTAAVLATADGQLRFEAEAYAPTAFSTARTSFCVLHPAGLAGHGLRVVHPDESVEAAAFPDAISALQPFQNIRALSHEVSNGFRATIRMEGDVWEMEDQRNWTDASFKTYGRPLGLPWPYTIESGARLRQTAMLTFDGKPNAPSARTTTAVTATLGPRGSTHMPDVALAVSPTEAKACPTIQKSAIAPHRLICWFKLGEQGPDDLRAYTELARGFPAETSLELILPCERPLDQEMAEAATLVAAAGLKPDSITPIQAALTKWVRKTPEELGVPGFGAVYAAARAAFPGVKIGAGVVSNFTELNIDRPPLEGADYVTHCTAAVIHEADDRSVMETLETLPHIFRSVRQLAGDLPYRLGPSAIGMRYNPYGASTEPNEGNIRIAFAHQDPRHRGLFGAAFALGYFSRAAAAGLAGVCLGALTGPFGLAYRKMNHAQPWFDEQSGALVYPLYHVIAAMAGAKGAPLRSLQSSDEKRMLGLAWERPNGATEIWLANLTAQPQTVNLAGPTGRLEMLQLDAASFARATRDPRGLGETVVPVDAAESLLLKPYAVTRLVMQAA